MADIDWGGILAAFGPVGVIVTGVAIALAKSGFLAREDPSRNDVLAEVKAMRKENAEESRAIRKEVAAVSREVVDRLARAETTLTDHDRRLGRLE